MAVLAGIRLDHFYDHPQRWKGLIRYQPLGNRGLEAVQNKRKLMAKYWEVSPFGDIIGDIDVNNEREYEEIVELASFSPETSMEDKWLMASAPLLLEACKLAMGALVAMPETPESKLAMDEIRLAMESASGKHWRGE